MKTVKNLVIILLFMIISVAAPNYECSECGRNVMDEMKNINPCECPKWWRDMSDYMCSDTGTTVITPVGRMQSSGGVGCCCLPCWTVGSVFAFIWIVCKSSVACTCCVKVGCMTCGTCVSNKCKKTDHEAIKSDVLAKNDINVSASTEQDGLVAEHSANAYKTME